MGFARFWPLHGPISRSLAVKILASASLLLAAALSATSCGVIKIGTLNPKDPVPNGTIERKGVFPGPKVTGSVLIYRLTDTLAYVIRFEALSAPSEGGLVVLARLSDGSEGYRGVLKANTGSQNYETGIIEPKAWSTVSIVTTSGDIYGTAILQ